MAAIKFSYVGLSRESRKQELYEVRVPIAPAASASSPERPRAPSRTRSSVVLCPQSAMKKAAAGSPVLADVHRGPVQQSLRTGELREAEGLHEATVCLA
jgi:hypothetical protein